MEYKEELVHNVPAIAWNVIISKAKRVEDNVLCMMTAFVIVNPAMLQNTAANLPHALPKAPNTFVIKQVYMPMGKLKAARLCPKPTKARAQQ